MEAEVPGFGVGESEVPVNIVDATSQASNPEFNPKVFWGVNVFIVFLICLSLVWCCFVQKHFVNEGERLNRSDEIYRQRRQRRLEAQKGAEKEPAEKRRRNLHASFAKHKVQMVVKEEDLIIAKTGESDIEAGDHVDSSLSLDEEAGHLKLGDENGRLVPNCCAVCLSAYSPGDVVVWSSNKACTHAFHRECVDDWLIKMQPETPCPCCRQEFTDLEVIRKRSKVSWLGTFAFDLSSVSLR